MQQIDQTISLSQYECGPIVLLPYTCHLQERKNSQEHKYPPSLNNYNISLSLYTELFRHIGSGRKRQEQPNQTFTQLASKVEHLSL